MSLNQLKKNLFLDFECTQENLKIRLKIELRGAQFKGIVVMF